MKKKTHKTQVYATYKRLISVSKSPISSKRRDAKRYFMQMETKESRGSYTDIR